MNHLFDAVTAFSVSLATNAAWVFATHDMGGSARRPVAALAGYYVGARGVRMSPGALVGAAIPMVFDENALLTGSFKMRSFSADYDPKTYRSYTLQPMANFSKDPTLQNPKNMSVP
jgi:hypothetical protein